MQWIALWDHNLVFFSFKTESRLSLDAKQPMNLKPGSLEIKEAR